MGMTPIQTAILFGLLLCLLSIIGILLTNIFPAKSVINLTQPPPTLDLRPRISNCLHWRNLTPGDDDKQICVAGTLHGAVRDDINTGKAFVVRFDEYESVINKRFYVIVYMKFRVGEQSWGPGNWTIFERRFRLLDNYGTCVGVTGDVINEKLYRADPTDTYYIWINYPESVQELDGCP